MFLPGQSVSWPRTLTSTHSNLDNTDRFPCLWQSVKLTEKVPGLINTIQTHGRSMLGPTDYCLSRVIRATHAGTSEQTPGVHWIQGCFLLFNCYVSCECCSELLVMGQPEARAAGASKPPTGCAPKEPSAQMEGRQEQFGAHPAPVPGSASHSGNASALFSKSLTFVPGTRGEGVLPLHYLAVTVTT